MIICFTTDLHGRTNLFEQTVELLQRATPDLLIFGGDILPDADMSDPSPGQVGFVAGYFTNWLTGLRHELPACQVAIIYGNHDWLCSVEPLEALESQGLLTILRPDRAAEFGGWQLLGYSYSPPAPFFTKDFERLDRPGDALPLAGGGRWDEVTGSVVEATTPDYFTSHPSIQEDLADVPSMAGQWIFVSHSPPAHSHLDLLITGQPVGSHAVRDFIEQRQPPVSLHGHLHDSPYVSGHFYERIGETVAINPGQGTETLAAVTFDPADAIGTIQPHGVRLPTFA